MDASPENAQSQHILVLMPTCKRYRFNPIQPTKTVQHKKKIIRMEQLMQGGIFWGQVDIFIVLFMDWSLMFRCGLIYDFSKF